MENISTPLSIFFILTTIATVVQFYRASGYSKKVLWIILVLMVFQLIIGLSGFYQTPPRFLLLLPPNILMVLFLFLTRGGRAFIDSLDLKKLTLLHTVRIPVEITLYYVFLSKLIPVNMTFEGNNFDIIAGITAPIIYYLVFVTGKASRTLLLVWNFLCLALLLNVLTFAVLSAQTPLQKLAFDQPNIGVTYFPFVWLPTIIVPIVFLSQLAGIRQLIFSNSKELNAKF
ncbi:hypothetical protein [Xanthovirga aplysinae]|uniref:hypothetical protein n=1 Tax=Xanthovirga aplysinae TaxID=2529853 RepID=UPI0012BBE6DF|nr:hypothetical protein [Xanthovirga aplysinae]MTI31968.1 hypothetical protein [Xanthovirga aplysinae]